MDFKTGTTSFRDHLGQTHKRPTDQPVAWRISAYALISIGDGVILVECVEMPGLWMLPGGGIDPHESLIDGLIRECREELGTVIAVPSQQPRSFGERDFYSPWTGQYLHGLAFIFGAEVARSYIKRLPIERTDDPEVLRVAKVPLQDLYQSTCHPVAWDFLKTLMTR